MQKRDKQVLWAVGGIGLLLFTLPLFLGFYMTYHMGWIERIANCLPFVGICSAMAVCSIRALFVK